MDSESRIETVNSLKTNPRAAGETQGVSRVPSAPREGGNAPTQVPTERKPQTPEQRETEPGARRADTERVEQPVRLPSERNEPARSGGSGAAEHSATERAGGGTRAPRSRGTGRRGLTSDGENEPCP